LESTRGFLPAVAAEVLERLTTAKPKRELSFNGFEFVVATLSEIGSLGVRLGCTIRMSAGSAAFVGDEANLEVLAA
jgi:hypothetical protein